MNMNLKANINGQLVDLGPMKILDRYSLPVFAKSEVKNMRPVEDNSGYGPCSPENLYAEIKVNGEVKARVWKQTLHASREYYDFALEATNIETLQGRVDFLAQAIGGEVAYHNQNTSLAYSFSDSLAKALADSK